MNTVPDNQRFTINTQALRSGLTGTALEAWCDSLIDAVTQRQMHHGDLPRWQAAFDQLPDLAIEQVELDHPAGVCAMTSDDVNTEQAQTEEALPTYTPSDSALELEPALKGLRPWRKGPFRIGHVTIDTEWRSDWKWNRILPHISDLSGRTVLDVGCGNGYHLWRMRSAGASTVLGIDPSVLFSLQFQSIQKYINDDKVHLLPLTMELLPANMQLFDTVFSMGVLYHRQDPHAHLNELLRAMQPGGELILETLVSLGEDASTLELDGRYARMRNIYSLPSVAMLGRWMKECGFIDIRFVSMDITSRLEQRTTEWMPFESLAESLNPEDMSLTVEGHPRPRRAVMIAQTPA